MQGSDKGLCHISLPEGLQELMSDITREVLRAQPQNVYSFIANYLSVLLEIRNNISTAVDLCNDIDKISYHTTLVQELNDIGLVEEDVVKAADIIIEFLENNNVKESSLFLQILRKTSIEEDQLKDIQCAVHKAFQRHRLSQSQINLDSQRPTADDIASFTSFAGSYITLPKDRPYSAHDDFSNKSEKVSSAAVGTHTETDDHGKDNALSNTSDEETESDTSSIKTVKFSMTYS